MLLHWPNCGSLEVRFHCFTVVSLIFGLILLGLNEVSSLCTTVVMAVVVVVVLSAAAVLVIVV